MNSDIRGRLRNDLFDIYAVLKQDQDPHLTDLCASSLSEDKPCYSMRKYKEV